MLTAGVDIGGTKVFAALVDEAGGLHERVSHPTDPEAGAASVLHALDQLLGGLAPGRRPTAIGVAAAALVEYPSGRIEYAPNLLFEVADLPGAVRDHVGIPTVVENDANAAVWAERQFGAATGTDGVLMLAVGTGIGGGVVIEGELFRGHLGFAAELGHVTLIEGGPQCACGERGCLEALASGTAIGRMAREGIAAAPDSIVLELAGGSASRISGALVSEAAHAGDEFAAGILARAGHWLGVGLAGLVNAFDPELIVIGGGGAGAGWFLVEPAKEELRRRLGARRPIPPVVTATLGNDAGAVGAASLARLRILGAHESG